jgi:hypothetical protein
MNPAMLNLKLRQLLKERFITAFFLAALPGGAFVFLYERRQLELLQIILKQ